MWKIKYPNNLKSRNPEFNILMLLSVNKRGCQYSDLINEKIKISESSVNNYLKSLQAEVYIKKDKIYLEEGVEDYIQVYKITSYGLERLDYLKSIKREPTYPPENIGFSHEEKIIWMLNTNDFCVWSHLNDKRLDIPQGTLSNKLKELKRTELIEKVIIDETSKPAYRIKPKGKKKYIEILKKYNFDPETIRKETIKRIQEISNENKIFFDEYEITDPQIQYRFKKYHLLLDYTEYKKIFRSEVNYNLTLLYLSHNHPNQFSTPISIENFSEKYNIKIENLKHYLSELFEEDLISFRIFPIELKDGKVVYFHEKEKIGRILKSIIEEYFEINVHLLPKEDISESEKISTFTEGDIYEIVNLAINRHQIFDKSLRSKILAFIPHFIQHLAIKIQKKQEKLVREKDKISGEIDMLEYIKTYIDISEIPMDLPLIKASKPDKEKILSFAELSEIAKEKGYPEAIKVLEDTWGNRIKDRSYFVDKCFILDKYVAYDELLKTANEGLQAFPEAKWIKNFKIYALISTGNYQNEEILNLKEILLHPEDATEIAARLLINAQCELAEKILENCSYFYKGGTSLINNFASEILIAIRERINTGNYVEALKIIDTYIFYAQIDTEIHREKIRVLIGLGRYLDALDAVNLIIKKRPKYPLLKEIEPDYESYKSITEYTSDEDFGYTLYLQKARILNLLDKYDESINLIDSIIERNPNLANSYEIKSVSLYYLQDYDKAVKLIDKAIKLEPEKSHYYSIKSNCFFKEHKLKDALEQIEIAIKLDSNIPENYCLKSQILLFMNRHDEALITINEGIEKFPENPDLHETKSLVIYGNNSESLKALEKAESLGGIISLYNKAQLLNNLGRYKEALETIEIEIKEEPKAYSNYDMKAMILMNMERYEEALKFREKSLNISGLSDKDSGCIKEQILCRYAVYLAEHKSKKKAIEVAEEVVKLSGPEWASDSYEAYGDIFMFYKEYEEALDKYEKARKSHIPSFYINLKIGICHFELGNYDEALKFLEYTKYQGKHSVVTQEVDEDGNRVQKYIPQTEIIEEAERYISRIKKLNRG